LFTRVSIISTIVFGLEFIASLLLDLNALLDSLFLFVVCVSVGRSVMPSLRHCKRCFQRLFYSFPSYWYAMSIFAIINGGDIGGSYSQVPKPMVIMVYVGFVFVVIALALFIASLALAGSSFTMLEFITYGQITIASSMIMWFFILFWIVAAISHRSIQLQSPSSFIGYGF
ncbi:hypothetical protein BCR42DRAFT_429941, partial [Absidia repens]